MERIATTPFGGARMCAEIFSLQSAVAKRQHALKTEGSGNDAGTADKWQLLRALTEARVAYGLSDRTLAVLEALTSFHPDRLLDGRNPIIVFPSNIELSLRTRGMSAPTLRRHLAVLVEGGLILRRDSANGKRFCRRDEQGSVEAAFGFDLAPLALLAGDIYEKAEQARARTKAVQALRMEITLHLRDIAKIVDAALAEERGGDWIRLSAQLAALSGRISRAADVESLCGRRDGLAALRAEVERTYLKSLSEQEMSVNDAEFERHISNSNTDSHIDNYGNDPEKRQLRHASSFRIRADLDVKIPLERLLALCPDLSAYALAPLRSWQDVKKTAELVRSILGVSPDAWRKAVAAMGDTGASIVVAAILQRGEEIRSPGGYLRELTAKAEKGRFSIQPLLKALEG